jgi:dihydropteroate synthase
MHFIFKKVAAVGNHIIKLLRSIGHFLHLRGSLKPAIILHLSAKDTIFHKRQFINIKGDLYDLSTPKVMGILNVTPDSFHDGGKYNAVDSALLQTEKMLTEGADIIDIGAVSTRPGAQMLSAEDEWLRLEPVLAAINKKFPKAILSIDTYHAQVAKRAISLGAHIINDVSAGQIDTNMFTLVAELQVPYIMMHMQGTPQTMQQNPGYSNVVVDVMRFFSERLEKLRMLGVNDIILDPGFGFGKTLEHNYELLNQLTDFELFDLPILIGISRKSMINRALGTKPENALNGTTALHAFALERGANILRVHDVKEAKQVVTLHQHLHQ